MARRKRGPSKAAQRKGGRTRPSQRKGKGSRKRKGTTAGAKPGSGKNFRALKGKLAKRKGVKNPGALAAAIGRQKYGKKGMAKLSAKGRKRRK